MDFTLSQEQYEALVALSRAGVASDPNQARDLEQWLRGIEKQNGVTRSFVKVQWQELGVPLPPGTFFPTKWPPEMRADIEFVTRPVAKVDVEKLLAQQAKKPTEVLCTRDPAGVVGWAPLDDFFQT